MRNSHSLYITSLIVSVQAAIGDLFYCVLLSLAHRVLCSICAVGHDVISDDGVIVELSARHMIVQRHARMSIAY